MPHLCYILTKIAVGYVLLVMRQALLVLRQRIGAYRYHSVMVTIRNHLRFTQKKISLAEIKYFEFD